VVKHGALLVGYNTDHVGVTGAISMRTDIENKRVLILGAGGAARAAAFGCLQKGASRVSIANRTLQRAEDACQALTLVHPEPRIFSLSFSDADDAVEHHDIIINATTLGLNQNENSSKCLLKQARFTERHTLLDMVYTPRKTELLERAEKQGAQICDGLLMLVFQAFEQARNLKIKGLSRPALMNAYAAISDNTLWEELLLGRARIDNIDLALITLLSERFETAARIGTCKEGLDLDIVHPKREKRLREFHRQTALAEGVDPLFIQTLFDQILTRSKALQQKN